MSQTPLASNAGIENLNVDEDAGEEVERHVVGAPVHDGLYLHALQHCAVHLP